MGLIVLSEASSELIVFHGLDKSMCVMDSEQGECGSGFGPRGSLHRGALNVRWSERADGCAFPQPWLLGARDMLVLQAL